MKCETCLHNEICRFNSIPTFGMDNVACQYEAHELVGEWIFDGDYPMFGSPYGSYKCSKCGMHTDDEEDNYCWFCGARMKEGEAE